jgi:hypothetical protein
MPTILNFRSDKFDEALVILNEAKKEEGKISSEYQMTPFRIVELVMYLKGKKQREVKKENRMR